MTKIWAVFGTRPEAIKMSMVVKALKKNASFEVKAVSTGQHRELLSPVLETFGIEPDISFNTMIKGQSLNQLSQNILGCIDAALKQDKPDCVLVHGDTTTSAMTALSAFHRRIPVAHVEAGLRTGDIASPFPEEMNRCLVGRIATLHFSPTTLAADNLVKEAVPKENIFVTGNTVIDALYHIRDLQLANNWVPPSQNLANLDLQRPILLITGHRRENFGEGFAGICEAIKQLAVAWPQWQFVYPVHLNPNVQEPVNRILRDLHNVMLIPPLDYQEFVWLMQRSAMILTDSGGIQEEGPALGKPVLVMRDVTERPEALVSGVVQLVGSRTDQIVSTCRNLMEDSGAREAMSRIQSPYGDGKAADRIASILAEKLSMLKSCKAA